MTSRFVDLERKTLLVQFVAVQPLTFYSTSDGTDLVQDILRSQLARSDADIIGQEGALSIDDYGEFLAFEPADVKNQNLHLPIEHLAYCGALRRLRRDPTDRRESDQLHQREFENVDLANRFPHLVVGPPIFVAVFHGFDNALCYTFVTQSADDACLLVMKLMRAFKTHEQQLEQQGQVQQGPPSLPSQPRPGSSSPIRMRQRSPFAQPTQPFVTDHRSLGISPSDYMQRLTSTGNTYHQDPRQDDIIQRLLSNPNLQLVSQPTPYSSQRYDDRARPPASSPMNRESSPFALNNRLSPARHAPSMERSSSLHMRPPSPPILGIPEANNPQHLPIDHSNPQVIYKPNNQEVVYKQNIMVRWLQPPTPPPPAPIIIREVQAPGESQPPIVCRQVPRCPPTPPPIIVREKPPPCPPPGQPLIIEKRIPGFSAPRQVIVERYAAPPQKPPTIIYEKYLPAPQQTRQVIVRREICQPNGYPAVQQQMPTRRLVREVVRQVPQPSGPAQPALICVPQQQQQMSSGQAHSMQQLVPVYATRQHVVQPQGVRVIRQVIGPSQGGQQVFSANGQSYIPTVQPTLMQ